MAYKNKEDQSAASKAHYHRHKALYKERSLKRNRNRRKWAREFVSRVKAILSCVDCGEPDPIVLEFDHVRGKKVRNIADMVNNSYSIDSIKKEIRKCEVRCANCHRRKTYERRSSKKS